MTCAAPGPEGHHGVPFFDLVQQTQAYRAELLGELSAVIDSGRFVMGAKIARFETLLADFCGTDHAVAVSSGSDALLAVLMALGVDSHAEVITSPYTFFATAGAIARLGAKPVFVDIDPVDFNMASAAVRDSITSKSTAILPVHLFGQMADVDGLLRAANRCGAALVEDAAQAIGAEGRGRKAGSVGLAGCFSFFPAKNLGALGDAGAVVTSDHGLADLVRRIRNHGSVQTYEHVVVGGNFRMDEFQAAVLSMKLTRLGSLTTARQRNASQYTRLFEESALTSGERASVPQYPSDEYPVVVPRSGRGLVHVYNQYVIRALDRDALKAWLDSRGVGNAVYYPRPLHTQPCFAYLGYRDGSLPEAERASRETLALPIYPELGAANVERVVGEIRAFYATVHPQ